MMNRYQTMRTLIDPSLRQTVHANGTIDIELLPAATPVDEVVQRYRTTPFDHAGSWPVRMGLVVDGDHCTHAVLVMSHMVLDGAGGVTMMTETTARVTTPVAGLAPLEQARQQALPAARRHNEAALRHWERSLRGVSPVTLPADPQTPRYRTGVFRSAALPAALRAGDSAAGLLAAFAMAFAEVTGVETVPFRLMSSNRFRPGLDGVVCPVSQNGLCVLPTDGGFGTVAGRARAAAMTAYKYAYYDRRDLDALLAGIPDDLDVNFNDRRFGGSLRPVTAPAATEFVWQTAGDEPMSGLFVSADGTDDVIELTVTLDTHFMSPAAAVALTYAMERIAVEACR
jgi:hypothetical protein